MPEECGLGLYGGRDNRDNRDRENNNNGSNKDKSTREDDRDIEAKEVESRGIFELHSILAAIHLHFERIQLGISPKSGLQITETSQNHPFFKGLKNSKTDDFLRFFLLGEWSPGSGQGSGDVDGEGQVSGPSHGEGQGHGHDSDMEIEGEVEGEGGRRVKDLLNAIPNTISTASSFSAKNFKDGKIDITMDSSNKLETLARQLHLSMERVRKEILLFCDNLDEGPLRVRGKHPRRFSRAATPKAKHSSSSSQSDSKD